MNRKQRRAAGGEKYDFTPRFNAICGWCMEPYHSGACDGFRKMKEAADQANTVPTTTAMSKKGV